MEMPSDIARKLLKLVDPEAETGALCITYFRKDGSAASFCNANTKGMTNSQVIRLMGLSTNALRDMTEDFAGDIAAQGDGFTKEQVVMMILDAANRFRILSREGKGKTSKITEEQQGGGQPPKRPRFRL